ncbi:DNA topoisomerase IB [Comamonas sp. NLF-1-9]|uniref:DNA topoisomerase IB n=1 Tax=Comamonas sp. NLF-1-9 TaxID=2853163 RepID=UPI00351CE5F5
MDDYTHGWRRVRRGRGFSYLDEHGRVIRDKQTLARLRKLAIPPAYTDVWICPDPAGHLQATGRDAKGRKQYRYHPLWKQWRSAAKFDRMLAFGRALPALRRAVQRDLARRRLDLTTVAAAVVRVMDLQGLRVGNEVYTLENGSYGLTTLQRRHAKTRGTRLLLKFRGKSHVMRQCAIDDRRVVRIARRCQDLPGQRLFQFLDETGEACEIRSDHVNDYIRGICGKNFTAKDFRTWHGSVHAMALALENANARDGDGAPSKLDAGEVAMQVARHLGNTPAVCRKFYIHPAVLALFGPTGRPLPRKRKSGKGLSQPESALLALLASRKRAKRAKKRDRGK